MDPIATHKIKLISIFLLLSTVKRLMFVRELPLHRGDRSLLTKRPVCLSGWRRAE
jgi:hypothetical protein